jgi:hypothetical protein
MHEQLFESLFVEVCVGTTSYIIGTIYRSPLSSTESNNFFLTTLSSCLLLISKEKKTCCILGDFNYNLLNTDDLNTNLFVEAMTTMGFHSVINKPTRITKSSATLIDHIWTNNFNIPFQSDIVVDCIADHLPVFIAFSLPSDNKSSPDDDDDMFRSFNFNNIYAFNCELSNLDWQPVFHCTEVDTSFDMFMDHFSAAYE